MGAIKFSLNKKAVGQLLKSDVMQKVLEDKAKEISRRAKGNYSVDSKKGVNRITTMIKVSDKKTYYGNLKKNYLLKSLR